MLQLGSQSEKLSGVLRKSRADTKLEARCIKAANQLSERFRPASPPFPLEPLLEHFKITEVRERPLDRDAWLRVNAGGFFIEVNILYPPPVRRFGIAHEIAHLIVSNCSRGGHTHWGHHDVRVEDLCDRLAGLLLAPDWAVCRYLGQDGRSNLCRGRTGKRTLRSAASLFGIPVKAMSFRAFNEVSLGHIFSE
jgi:hypothetical protein